MAYTFKELEQMLNKYKWYLKESKIIELSIRFPTQKEGEQVGGRSNIPNTDSMLQTLIKLEEHETLNQYQKIGMAIERTYAELPEHLQYCMKLFYIDRKGPFRGHPRATAAKLNVDVSTLYRWRLKITEEFHEQLKR